MGVLHGNPFLLASGTATEPAVPLQRSVRLRSSQSAYFNRTSGVPTNGAIFTHSFWVKRGILGSQVTLISGQRPTNFDRIYFSSTDTLFYHWNDGTSNLMLLETTQVFRDPSAWYHIVVVTDTTQATNTNRIKFYVNGVQVTTFVGTPIYPSQNSTSYLNRDATTLNLGRTTTATLYFDGYLTEVYFIDGQALTPSSFGGYNAGTNVWEVRKYTGTYGTNGFYLPFTNPASIGADGSGNGNNWTPNGIQISNSALTTYDSMLDVPTNTGSTNANFATLNPLTKQAGSLTLTDGNLNTTRLSAGWARQIGTIGMSSGKWYFEVAPQNNTTSQLIGVGQESSDINNFPGAEATSWGFYTNNGTKYNNGTATAYGTYTPPQIVGVAVDMDAGKIWFSNGATWQASGDPAAGTNPAFSGLTGTVFPQVALLNASTQAIINFGQRPFTHTPPSGFKSLNTFNLPEPTIPRGDKYFEQYLYTGNGGGQQVGEIQKPASLFNLDRSLRFRKSNSSYLSRTQTTTTNSVKCTFSGWVKRGELGTLQVVFGGYTGTDADTQLYFDTTNQLKFTSRITNVNGAALEWAGESAAVFRDPQLWLHIVVKVDTSALQATNNAYYTVYVNGIAQTFTTISGASLVTAATVQNRNTCWNVSGYTNTVARHRANHFDGYIADIYFIDGQALDATSFGAFDGNNYWTPKAYTGTYGNNGFHLEFEDFSNNTATTIGKDTSGQGNNWTPTGINVTTPANTNASWDSMVDVPTLTSADVANFATLNPVDRSTGAAPTNGNLNYTFSAGTYYNGVRATIGISSGKWYWETTCTAIGSGGVYAYTGIATNTFNYDGSTNVAINSVGTYYYMGNANKSTGTGSGQTTVAYGSTYTTNDVIGVALDMDVGTLTFYKNGVSQGIAYTGLSGTFFPAIALVLNVAFASNFGQRPFRYSNYGTDRPAATFKPINSFNVAEIIGDVETPDLVWIKSRSAGTDHALFNSVAGTGKYLRSSNSGVEVTDVNSLIQFNKNGFLLGNAAIVNALSATFVASAWKAGNTTVTNTDGRQTVTITIASPAVVTATGHSLQNGDVIQLYTTGALPTGLSTGINYYVVNRATNTFQLSLTSGGSAINTSGTQSGTHSCTFYSQVRANQEAGFSIVTYTGTGANATVGHGLGVAPKMVIVKNRTAGGAGYHITWHYGLTSASYYLALNITNGQTLDGTVWNSTVPTSSVFSIGTNTTSNNIGTNFVAYCFSEIEGYSKFGSYTANNDPNGPFVYTGFRPRWLIVKRATTGTTGGWFMYDTARNTYNVMDKYLFAEGAAGDNTLAVFDFTSNGFKIRSNNVHVNSTAGNTYIYMAFAENPFKYALAR